MLSSRESAVQIDSRLLPFALHGALRGAIHRSDFGEGEAAEEFEIDDRGEFGFDEYELFERIADERELAGIDGIFEAIESDYGSTKSAAFLEGGGGTDVIDDEAAHHTRCVGHE